MSDCQVSVVVAVRNEEKYVESAALSIISQQDINHEVIIVDDNSTDNTYSILSSLADQYPQLRIFKNAKKGKCSAFNYGVSMARGSFVCLFAGDDIMPPGSLRARFDAVKDHPSNRAVVGLSKIQTMSDNKKFDGRIVPRRKGQGSLSGQSPLMNRAVIDKIFPVPETLPNEDTWTELAITLFPNWIVIHSDIINCLWRCHEGNSINFYAKFPEYNTKFKARMAALDLFRQKYGNELSKEGQEVLDAKIKCEENRASGNIVGIMGCNLGLVERLRAVSTSNAFFYGLRKYFWQLFSGW